MSEPINTGGPAFPMNWEKQGEFWAFGMTLRDYFAAKALQSIVTHKDWELWVAADVADWSYEFADAMIKAREAQK